MRKNIYDIEWLSPFWMVFAVTLTETVGAGSLALPIALAKVGPLIGCGLLIVLGLINVLTIAATAEAAAHHSEVRNGRAYFGQLVADYLGHVGGAVFMAALVMLTVIFMLVYYIGFASVLQDATTIPREVWIEAIFAINLFFLSRKTLNLTAATSLVIGVINIGIIGLLSCAAFRHITAANLFYMNVSFLHDGRVDVSMLELVFGVILLAYFGHVSCVTCAHTILQREPDAKSLIRGSMAGMATAIPLYCLWVVAVNGAIAPQILATETGTALSPLARQIGPWIHVPAVLYVVLSIGMVSVHRSLCLFKLLHERVATFAPIGNTGRFLVSVSPVLGIFVIAEWLVITGHESFTGMLSFTGTITATIVAGIFPMLMLVVSRRKGDCLPDVTMHFLGSWWCVASICGLFFSSLLLHGFVIWKEPVQQIAAVVAALLIMAATLAMRKNHTISASILK